MCVRASASVYLSQPLRLKGEGRYRLLLPIRKPVEPKKKKKKTGYLQTSKYPANMQEKRNTRTEKTEIQNTFTLRMLELWSKNTETRKEQQFQGDLKKALG
jgi:lipopolysaccharide export LptBFGC system permease protein LptF